MGKCGIAWAGSEMNEDLSAAIITLCYTQAGSGAVDLH